MKPDLNIGTPNTIGNPTPMFPMHYPMGYTQGMDPMYNMFHFGFPNVFNPAHATQNPNSAHTMLLNPLFSSPPTRHWCSGTGALAVSLAIPGPHRDVIKSLPIKSQYAIYLLIELSSNPQMMRDARDAYSDLIHLLPDAINDLFDLVRFLNRIGPPSSWLKYQMLVQKGQGDNKVPVEGLCLFKKGIHPSWEDKANANGGHWEMKFEPGSDPGHYDETIVDHVWLVMCFSLIGDPQEVDPMNIVNGIRLVKKSRGGASKITFFHRLEIWIGETSEQIRDELFTNISKALNTSFTEFGDGTSSYSLANCEYKHHNSHDNTTRYKKL